MILPEIINYLLTLKYPGSEIGRQDWVCYQYSLQVDVPLIRSGQSIVYTVRPAQGIHAMLGYLRQVGTNMVPNTFVASIAQFGVVIFSNALITQTYRDSDHPGFMLVTEQEPLTVTVTNISPLAQRGEMDGHFILIPTPQDLVTVIDALRRLHTSTGSEKLLQQAVHLLGLLSGQPVEPRPPVGGS